MSYHVSHMHQDDLLHITVKGALNNAEHLPVWNQVFDLSHQHSPASILLECILNADRISMDHCFEMIDRLPLLCRLLDCRIAICEKKAGDEARELFKFVETAAQDRGADIQLFSATEDAHIWLKS